MTEIEEPKSNRDNFKYALCYIPFVSILFFFTEVNRDEDFDKHIKYWFFMLISYMILFFFLGWLFWRILWFVYLLLSWFIWYKVYNWEKVNLEVFDTLETSVKSKMQDNKKQEK